MPVHYSPFNNIEVLISYCVLDIFLGKILKLLIYLYSLIDKYYFSGKKAYYFHFNSLLSLTQSFFKIIYWKIKCVVF